MISRNAEIHGHEILMMVHEADAALTREDLRRLAAERFGADARYRTCAGGGMTIDGLIEFLLARGKLIERKGRICADISQMCDDDGH